MVLASLLLASALRADLDAVLNHTDLAGALVGACVMRQDGTVLYKRNPDARMVPASNQKLLACAFALDRLGPDWKPKTEFWKDSDVIVVWTTGDPMATFADWRAVGAKLGVPPGAAFRVAQPFDPAIPPSWEWDDLPNKYAARVASLTVNRGSFELWGGPEGLELRPSDYGVRIVHFDQAGPARVRYEPHVGVCFVSGTLPEKAARLDTLALPDPTLAAVKAMGGGSWTATVSVPDRKPDLVVEGRPIREIVAGCLPPSDNNLAEALVLLGSAGGSGTGRVGYGDVSREMRAFVRKATGDAAFRPDDGSGMSRHNLVTARGLAQLLVWAGKQPWASVYFDNMAAPGRGTLASRLAGSTFRGKTGTLDMVSSLSGIVDVKGERLAVSLLMNHYACPAARARALQDAFIGTLERGTLPGNDTGIPWNRAYSPAEQLLRAPLRGDLGSHSHLVAVFSGTNRRVQPIDASPVATGRGHLRGGQGPHPVGGVVRVGRARPPRPGDGDALLQRDRFGVPMLLVGRRGVRLGQTHPEPEALSPKHGRAATL